MIQYSFVVPIYNDAYLAEEFCSEYQSMFRTYLEKENIEEDTELIFVSDGSNDESLNILVRSGFCRFAPISHASVWRSELMAHSPRRLDVKPEQVTDMILCARNHSLIEEDYELIAAMGESLLFLRQAFEESFPFQQWSTQLNAEA